MFQSIIHFFRIINQQPKVCAIFFSNINPDAHVTSTKINTFTFKRGGGSGDNNPRSQSQRNVKQNESFSFLHQLLHTRCVDSSVMMLIQIRARGVRGHGPPDFVFI